MKALKYLQEQFPYAAIGRDGENYTVQVPSNIDGKRVAEDFACCWDEISKQNLPIFFFIKDRNGEGNENT